MPDTDEFMTLDTPEDDPGDLLGDAVWTQAEINDRPDAAFALIEPGGEKDEEGRTAPRSLRHLVHHTADVKKGTENSTVDKPHLRAALSRCSQMQVSQAMKNEARAHLRAHAKALGMGDAEVADLIGEWEEGPDYEAALDGLTGFADAEDLLLEMAEAGISGDLLEQAEARVRQFAATERESYSDSFEGVVENVTQGSDGLWHFTARVAQADIVNANKRLYPVEEFAKNLPRVNRLCKAGRFNGRDGHPGFFSADNVSEICVRYDAFMLQGGDLIAEGVLIPTQAGQDIATLWEHGVQTEWSIVSYAKPEPMGEGDKEYVRMTDLILDGCDPVRRGAAKTRTLKLSKPKKEAPEEEPTQDAATEPPEEDATPPAPPSPPPPAAPVEEPPMGEELTTTAVDQTTPPPAAPPAPPAPVVDTAAIRDELKLELATAAQGMVADAVAAARAETQLQAAKDAAVSQLAAQDTDMARLVGKHFDECKSADEVAQKVADITPMIEGLRKPAAPQTVGIHTKGDERSRFMLTGALKVVDRPETVEGVMEALLDGLEDNGREDASNKHWTMRKILDNYAQTRDTRRYLEALTRQGFAETATTSTALGTTLPMVLPIVRQMLPQLIPYAIGSVVPIDRPTARVYFYDPQYASGNNDGSGLDDSSVFDTAYFDHTEGNDKGQIKFAMTYTDVTAVEKSIMWDLTSVVIQDMQAIYSMDAEASMLAAATDFLALEINMKFLQTLVAGAGINAGTFGTGMPATGFQNLNDWLTWGLSQQLNRASSLISKKMYQSAGWVITGPTQTTLFESGHSYEKLPAGAVGVFGQGLRQTGTWNSIYQVYACDWAETIGLKNKMLVGYTPINWDRAAAVFCPYVPFYLSPVDANATKNTIARSASSRNAYKVLQANGLATVTVSSAAGSALTYVD